MTRGQKELTHPVTGGPGSFIPNDQRARRAHILNDWGAEGAHTPNNQGVGGADI